MTKTQIQALFTLLKRALGEKTPFSFFLEESDFREIYAIAQKHDLGHLLFTGIEGLTLEISPELLFKLRKKYLLASGRYAQRSYEYERIVSLFEENGIDHLPLKGAVLSALYPDPAMRTSCDIDILVHSEDLEKAEKLLTEELGYALGEKSTHDVAFWGTSDVRLELHFELNESDYMTVGFLSDIWQYLSLDEGLSHRYHMSGEHFVFYHIYHMAKHVSSGGCGIRPLMDLWILKQGFPYDRAALETLLQKEGLLTFFKAADALSEVWFGEGVHTSVTEELEGYLVGAGVYGTKENLIAIHEVKRGGKLMYFLRRVFLPYRMLKRFYPTLERFPILYPFYQIKRWFLFLLRKNKKETVDELLAARAVTKEKRKSLERLFSELEL